MEKKDKELISVIWYDLWYIWCKYIYAYICTVYLWKDPEEIQGRKIGGLGAKGENEITI